MTNVVILFYPAAIGVKTLRAIRAGDREALRRHIIEADPDTAEMESWKFEAMLDFFLGSAGRRP